MSEPGAQTAEDLQERARVALAPFAEAIPNEDGSLGFSYAGALCSLRAVNLADGLDVLSLTAVLAWDRPSVSALHRKVAERNAESQFGSIAVTTHGRLADVVLRYTFPGSGLGGEALTTMLVLVLSGVDRARTGLLGP